MAKRLPDCARREEGSFALESSVVLPLLLAVVLLFIVLGMYMYQKVVLYYAASSTAERAAFGWDNSNRDPRSGMLAVPQYDGLYWRMGDDQLLQGLFGLTGESEGGTVALPSATDESEHAASKLPERKLKQASSWLQSGGLDYKGELQYSRGLIQSSVQVRLKQPLSFPASYGVQSPVNREPKAVAATIVVDPVEFIRSVDLARYYINQFRNNGNGAGGAKAQAGKVIAPYQDASASAGAGAN